jgi:transmembrane sensor
MNHYSTYTVEQLIQDLRFRAWVKNPSEAEDQAWQQWLDSHEHKRQVVAEARAIVLAIHPVSSESISDFEINNEINDILAHIDDDIQVEIKPRRSVSFWMKIAASLTIVALAGWYAWNGLGDRTSLALQTSTLDSYLIEHVNKSEKPLLINLPDKSSVLLSQNSLIRYPREFKENTRNVVLEGNAFFEVTKNPDKPFYVEAGHIVAKVLGTSFEINASPEDSQVRVIVRSGSVSIFSNIGGDKKELDKQPSMVLTKDDQLIYNNEAGQIQHTRLNTSSLEDLQVPDTHMKFNGTPVKTVFSELARVYGVKINYEYARVNECSVTASFTDEPFALKLDLICRSIGVEYEILNNWVTIKGEGCTTN